MLSLRIFLWLVITFVPITLRNWGRERWGWYTSCPKKSDRRKIEFFLTLILLPCWLDISRNSGTWLEMGGFPIQVQEWLQSGESPGSTEASWVPSCSKGRYTPAMEWAQSGDCTSVASRTACCVLLRPSDMHIFRPSYLFHHFLKISLPWSFLLEWFVWGCFLQPKSYQSLL